MSETITLKKETLWKYSTFILAALLVVLAIAYFNKEGGTGNTVNNNNGLPAAAANVEVDDDAVLGSEDAPVTIIEFSDYQCPFCERFWSQTLPSLKKDYIDTGKVKLVFRDYPLDTNCNQFMSGQLHPAACKAAEATECIREQGGDEAFWELHDKIFGNQQALSVDNLKTWASDIGYDIDSCLDSGKYTKEVQEDIADGNAGGVRGTPAFFINGKLLSGAQPFSAFKQAIDAEL